MKKLLLVTTFLVTTSASALAECPYQGPLKSLMSQYRSISNNMNPFDLCSANYLAQNNQLIDLGQQIDAMSLKARRDSRCVLLEKGSVSSLAKSPLEEKASCTKYLSEKKSETPKPDIKPVEKSKDPINEDYSRFRGHSDDSLDSLLQTSKVPVAIYFWSQSCKSCYTEWFKIYELKIDSKINSVSINVDSFKKTAATYKVESFPTLIILDGDKVIQRISNVTKAKVEEALASLVAKKKVEAPKVVEKATVNPSSPKPNTTPDVNSTDYKEAEQEFSIADGIITANQKDNKLSCGDMLMVADKYAYAAKEYRKAGAEEKAQVADDKTARTIGALKEWDKQGYCSAKNMVAQSIKKNMTTAEETDDLRKRIKAALENPAIQPNDWKVRCEYLNGRPSLWKDSFWQSLIIICKDQGRWKGIP